MTFDSKHQRKIMGQFATGVTVVTTDGKAGPHGLTANAVASLSLDPPLVLVAVDKRTHSLDHLHKNGCFAINILRLDQEEISRRFATPGPKDFTGLDITTATTTAPILRECLAYVDCRIVETLPAATTRSLSAKSSPANTTAASRSCTSRGVIAGWPSDPIESASPAGSSRSGAFRPGD